ncbi:hypothetical protein ACFO4N_00275 [Camelliibacillus cellulosilyticus]|uniref:ABC-2 type transport system permease protein n=1 Tax=Camelliibacillus cellulosilyticus TaxID=2174486 RepID=A0ABV9GFV1_9BACL
MSAWWGLCKKEFRNGLPSLLFAVIAIAVIFILVGFIGWRNGHGAEVLFITALVIFFPHIFAMVFHMIYSLQREKNKLHLWLHNPLPGYGLLSAKLVNSFLSMTVTLFLTCIVGLISYLMMDQPTFFEDKLPFWPTFRLGIVGIIHLYLFAIDIAIWFIFFWVFYRALVRRLGVFVSLLVTFIVFLLLKYLLVALESTGIYTTLTHWGAMSLDGFIGGVNISPEDGITPEIVHTLFYLGSYVFEAVIALILYLAASWMLDRKVEV